jgi:hypothetical protein
MSKARTLANLISDNAELADGQISVAEVVGAAPTASPTFTGNIDAGDNVKIRLGDSDDLQFFHNGNNAFLDNDTGTLFIQTDALSVKNASGTESVMLGTADGAVTLYHNNEPKLATTSTGISVTGSVAVSDGIVDTGQGGSATVFNQSGSTADFRVESSGSEHMLFVDGGNNSVGIGTGNPVVSGQSTITIGTRTIVGKTVENQSLFSDNAYFTGSTWTTKETDSWASIRTNNNSIRFHTGGTHTAGTSLTAMDQSSMRLYISDSEVVFNKDSQDTDFRVESDSNDHMLFVDAANNYVGIGSATNYSAKLTVQGNKALTAGIPNYQLSVVDDTAMAAGTGGAINFWGKYATSGSKAEGASIEAYKANATSGDYQYGILLKSRTQGGSMDDRLYMDQTKTVFNETGANTDFRVASDTHANALFVDAGTGGTELSTTQSNVGLFIHNTTHDSIVQIQASGANKNSVIRFADGDDSDVGMFDYDHATNSLGTTVNASERTRITSDGVFQSTQYGIGGTGTDTIGLMRSKATSASTLNFDFIADVDTGSWSPLTFYITVGSINSNANKPRSAYFVIRAATYNGSLGSIGVAASIGDTSDVSVALSDQGGTDPMTVRVAVTGPNNRITATVLAQGYFGIQRCD